MLVALRPPVQVQRPPGKDEFSFLERRFTPGTVFMEIGSSFALRAAAYVERVYAVDISGRLLQNVLVPCNVRLVLGDGVHIPVPEASVDLAWGGAFMDRLDAGDAAEHLRSVRRALAPGGEYICRTRSAERLLEAGFSSVRSYFGLTRQARFAATK